MDLSNRIKNNRRVYKMRILANYGYKDNGNTYSVTFETVGDVAKDRADATVDELFRMAKAAIERQINPQADPLEFPPKEEVTVPQPKKNGNGKPQLKDPDAPLTKKQKSLIIRLAKERGQFIENLNSLTMQEASQIIDELMSVSV
jgi:predicted RNase H-like HicB family nuclease